MKEETKGRLIAIIFTAIPIIAIMGFMWYATWGFAWNIEYGQFISAEVNPERVINVTWVVLEDQTLMYGTYNPEVLDLIPGEYYWFGEGLISGNNGKRLLWVTDENPLT